MCSVLCRELLGSDSLRRASFSEAAPLPKLAVHSEAPLPLRTAEQHPQFGESAPVVFTLGFTRETTSFESIKPSYIQRVVPHSGHRDSLASATQEEHPTLHLWSLKFQVCKVA